MFEKSKFQEEQLNNELVLTYEDKNAFTAGTDIPTKTLKAVEDYRNDYIEKAIETAAQIGKEKLKKNNKIERVLFKLPYTTSARGFIDIGVDRSKTFHGVNGKPSVTKSKLTVVVKDPVNKASKKRIRDFEEDLTKSLLG